MPIDKVRYSCFVTDDMSASIAFFRDVLGLGFRFRDHDRWAEFDVGGGDRMALASREEVGDLPGPLVVFQATELDDVLQSILNNGGALLAARDMGAHGRVATVKSPSGEVFQLFARASSS
jgi:predicted enzyme related to lactoylglutathione lyase